MDCIFCKIANKEIKTDLLYEDENVVAFNDLNPVAKKHILVIPKKHYKSLEDIPENELDIVADIHKAIRKISKKYNFDKNGYRIINNCGKDGGQEVMHIHYHLLAGEKLPGLIK